MNLGHFFLFILLFWFVKFVVTYMISVRTIPTGVVDEVLTMMMMTRQRGLYNVWWVIQSCTRSVIIAQKRKYYTTNNQGGNRKIKDFKHTPTSQAPRLRVHSIASAFTSVRGTRRKQGVRASVFSWPAIPIIVFRMGRKVTCVLWLFVRGTMMKPPSGIDCGKDLTCNKRTGTNHHFGTVYVSSRHGLGFGRMEWSSRFCQKRKL